MLDQGIDGNCEESGKEPEQGQKSTCGNEGMRHASHKRRHNSHAQGAEGNKPVFDLVTRQIASDRAPDAYTERRACVKNGVFPGGQMENVSAINQDCLEKQSSQEPEICVAKNSEEERAVRAYDSDLLKEIPEKIEFEFFLRSWRRILANSQTETEPNHG